MLPKDIYNIDNKEVKALSFQPLSERRKKNSVDIKEFFEKKEKEYKKKMEEIIESWKKAAEKIKNEGNE
jgi:Txe/YoeB family toxin of Txe-Axe toxin-antitoxin module